MKAGRTKAATNRPAPIPEEEIPVEPPGAMKAQYQQASRAYARWCLGMFIWAGMCVAYFITTGQKTNAIIGVCLGILLVAMIFLPAMLFGGATWYKRLGWEMLLLGLFTAMWIYPIIVIGIGVGQRYRAGRYHAHLYPTDWWHLGMCVITVLLSMWTAIVTYRTSRLVRQLARGEFGMTEIVRK